MAISDPGMGRVIEQGLFPCKVTLSAACSAGDVLGVAEDAFDSLTPVNANVNAHATGVTMVARLVAGEDGEVSDIITAYPIAVVSGYSGGTLMKKLYVSETSANAGTVVETAPATTGDAASLVGITLDADTVLLFPALTGSPDTIAS